jgi:hypothetical protein
VAGTFFNQADVIAGLHLAMEFGSPNTAADKATFYMPRTVTSDFSNEDSRGVSFNPDDKRTFGALVKKTVPCAVEYMSSSGKDTNFGTINPDRVKLTMLGPDYLQVQRAEYVVIKGQKYLYWKQEPVIALGSIDIYQTYWRSEDAY